MTTVLERDAATTGTAPSPLLQVSHLDVGFRPRGSHAVRPVVQDVSLSLPRGGCLALVGESGSGKSVTARTLVGLTGAGATVSAESLVLGGATPERDLDLASLDAAQWRRVRGGRIGFVLQDALVSLDPLRPVGREIDEVLRLHTELNRTERSHRVRELLASVGVPEPQLRAGQRPDQLSGGLRQRALIASALAGEPELLVADEPTTALDVTVQAQVLELLDQARGRGVGVLLISHDLSVVARLADTVAVMRGGRIVEQGPARSVLEDPQHEYTRALLAAVPSFATRGRRLSLDAGAPEAAEPGASVPDASVHSTALPDAAGSAPAGTAPAAPSASHVAPAQATRTGRGEHAASGKDDTRGDVVLQATSLRKAFRTPGGTHVAVADVSLALRRGRTLGIVGESGSGKSTTARLVLGLTEPDAGEVTLDGEAWAPLPEGRRRGRRRRISVVAQDPLSSFDPRWRVERIIADALPARLPRAERAARVTRLLGQVGLTDAVAHRLPLTLSGGQRQRVAIARALASEPEVIVLDEAVSALDVSVQAQVLDLLARLRDEFGLSYLFISHDLGVIAHLSDDVLVMRRGEVVESGDVRSVLTAPQHPYTQELVRAADVLHTPDRTGRRTA